MDIFIDDTVKKTLDDKQLAVVSAPIDKNICVFAVAGSGKTTTLKYRIYSMIKSGCREEEMMLLTFTSKAAKEMKDRVKDVLKRDRLHLKAGTFHSIAYSIIRDYGEYIGLNDELNILSKGQSYFYFIETFDKVVKKDRISYIEGGLNFGNVFKAKDIFNFYDYVNNFDISEKEIPLLFKETAEKLIEESEGLGLDELTYFENNKDEVLENFLLTFYNIVGEYKLLKEEKKSIDFNDLIEFFISILNNKKALDLINSRYKYIFVDEYQDINNKQYKILKKLSRKGFIFVIGDNNQCIYSFRGSNSSYITKFEKDFDNSMTFNLNYNYRSSPEILLCSQENINMNPENYNKKVKLIAKRNSEGEKVDYFDVNNDTEMEEILRDCLKNEMEENNYKEVCILTRTNKNLTSVEKMIIKMKLPYIIEGGVGFYNKPYVKTLLSYLSFYKTKNVECLKSCLPYFKGIGIKFLFKLDRLKENILNEKSLISVAETEKQKIFVNMIISDSKKDDIDIIWDFKDFILNKEVDTINNDSLLSESLKDEKRTLLFEELEGLTSFLVDDYSSFSSFKEFEIERLKFSNDIYMDGNFIKIMTIHKSKGLEWDKVIIPYVSDGVIPHIASIIKANNGDYEGIYEERKLFYVAMTRARKKLYLINLGYLNGNKMKPSRFIEPLYDLPSLTYNKHLYGESVFDLNSFTFDLSDI